MRNSSDIQAIVLAAGKGSRMLDMTGGGAKCLLPLGGVPLLYFPLKLLERHGFQHVLVTVPDSVKGEVMKLADRFNLALKLEVVGIQLHEEWGTLDTLRHIADRLTGTDLLLVSGDLITRENLRKVFDLHRAKKAGLTMLLNKPAFDLKTSTVPGSKSNKYKNERDLIGLFGETVCLFKAEADVEDEINIPKRILRANNRFTIHTNLQDTHLYIINKWILEEVLLDKTLTALKGEMIPKLVAAQFKAVEPVPENKMELDSRGIISTHVSGERQFSCYASITEEPTVRVNNIPSFWEGYRLLQEGVLSLDADLPPVHALANVHEKSQMKHCTVGSKSLVSEKTSLTGVSVGANCTIHQKVILNNTIIMDGVTIQSGANIKDSIICEGGLVDSGVELKHCIVGKLCRVPAGSNINNQILLDSDRMMHV